MVNHGLKDLSRLDGSRPKHSELAYVLSQISVKAGQNGRICAAFIEKSGCFDAMLQYAMKRLADNQNPSRPPYDILRNSCNHFMKQVLEAGGISTPKMFDPRPNSYINEIRASFPKLDYEKSSHILTVEGITPRLAGRTATEQAAAA